MALVHCKLEHSVLPLVVVELFSLFVVLFLEQLLSRGQVKASVDDLILERLLLSNLVMDGLAVRGVHLDTTSRAVKIAERNSVSAIFLSQ